MFYRHRLDVIVLSTRNAISNRAREPESLSPKFSYAKGPHNWEYYIQITCESLQHDVKMDCLRRDRLAGGHLTGDSHG